MLGVRFESELQNRRLDLLTSIHNYRQLAQVGYDNLLYCMELLIQ